MCIHRKKHLMRVYYPWSRILRVYCGCATPRMMAAKCWCDLQIPQMGLLVMMVVSYAIMSCIYSCGVILEVSC